MPFISVIIPTCNRISRVIEAVNSVLSQSFQDFELIVVDDGSTDNTSEKLRETYGSRIQLITQGNAGVSAARNAGVRVSRGKYLSFLDSDDTWHPDKLKAQVNFHQENPSFQISQTEEVWIRNGRRVNPHNKHQKTGGYIFSQSLHLCMVSPSSVIIRKSLFDESGSFDEQLKACEDYDLWLRLTATEPVGLIRKMLLTKHGGHEDQLSRRYPAMDRFRLYALGKVLLSDLLNESQQAEVREVIVEKLRVLCLGAEKRGRPTAPLRDLMEGAVAGGMDQEQFMDRGEKLLLDDRLFK